VDNLLGLPPDDLPLYLPLNPVLEETQTGRLMFSVGVNSEAGLIGSIVIDEQNFDWTRFPRGWEDIRNATAWRGAGQRFRIEAVPGTEVQRYAVNFQEPYLLNTSVGLGLSGYYYDRRYREWDEQRVGGRVSLSYQFTPDLSGVAAFRGANIKIFDPIANIPELTEVLGSNALYGFELRLIHDTRDSNFLPTEGHLFQISAEQVIGSFEYPRGEIDLRQYFMLRQRPDGSGRHVLCLGGKVAVSGDETPIYEHYFAGGFTTIRGFDFREASPRNMGIVVGGEFMLLASAEYMFPITADDALRGVVFVDTGTVEPTIDNWTDDYRVAPGFGLRITIPAMGPAPSALDLAFPVAHQQGDDIQNFSFFVGFLR
jgi:outer membrane protein insertion porin family